MPPLDCTFSPVRNERSHSARAMNTSPMPVFLRPIPVLTPCNSRWGTTGLNNFVIAPFRERPGQASFANDRHHRCGGCLLLVYVRPVTVKNTFEIILC